MDYEKKYKEALSWMQSLYNGLHGVTKEEAEHYFPELKENEDERIRRFLINFIKACGWTEKKGEQKPQGKTALEAINKEKVDNANKVEPKDYSSIDPHFGKPIDKVEPKFKAGDWIVWQGKYFKVNYNGCGYELTDQNGKSTSLEYGVIDKTANLWRIQDAKAGDVLYSPKNSVVECIVLIGGWKRLDGDKSLCAAITYQVKENEIEVPVVGAIWWSGKINSFCPATKLQRDILFQKMKEAGYEWDVDKKKLKKIENEIEIPYGAKDSELQEDTYYIPKGFHAEIDKDKVFIKKGEKPTWSEEDEYMAEKLLGWLSTLINYINEDAMVSIDLRRERIQQVEQIKTWLVSLKDRIHPKNDYNPYKEVVESIAKMCKKYDKYSHSILKDFFNNVKAKCKDAKEFDYLHPQNTKTISQ